MVLQGTLKWSIEKVRFSKPVAIIKIESNI
jgi:hypothetical protein